MVTTRQFNVPTPIGLGRWGYITRNLVVLPGIPWAHCLVMVSSGTLPCHRACTRVARSAEHRTRHNSSQYYISNLTIADGQHYRQEEKHLYPRDFACKS